MEYVIGFLFSLLLTGLAYFAVVKELFAHWTLAIALVGLGVVQAGVQFVFFLHLGKESRPRWRLIVFSFMVGVVAILVLGSLWIMYNLEERVMGGM